MKTRESIPAERLGDWLATHPQLAPGLVARLSEIAAGWAASGGIDAAVESETVCTLALLHELKVDDETLLAAALYPQARAHADPEHAPRHGGALDTLIHGQLEADKIWPLHEHKAANASAEGLRRLLLVLIRDLRVVFILLARQLVRLRAASRADEASRRRLAQLAADIHAPLANRLGIWQLKWELEDLTFRYLQPDTYKRVAALLDERREDRERYIRLLLSEVRRVLREAGIEADVAGRPKHIYSIWKKMQRKSVDFSELYDVRAVRVLVPDVPTCYAALGVVHAHWTPIPKEFDDYIAKPKGNDYRSLHTAIIGPEGKAAEVQIRTVEMHEHAELGVAAHWRYKEGSGAGADFERKIQWMRQLLEGRDEAQDDGALLAGFSTEVLEDRVYLLTPKGAVVDLPKSSTVLDFAYTVHTEVGHRCRGAKVNGRIVPLTHQPKTGDRVEILTAKEGQPKRDWLLPQLGFLNSSRARHKVRAWFHKLDREHNLRDGRDILERELKRLALTPARLEALLPKLHLTSVDELYLAVALGDLSPAQVARVVHEAEAPKADAAQILTQRLGSEIGPRRDKDAIVIEGVGNLLVAMAGCCNPVPGDAIVGFITKGRGVSVHRADCKSLLNLSGRNPERVIDVQWGGRREDRYAVRIRVSAYNRTGLIRDVGAVLAAAEINIGAMDSREDPASGLSTLQLTLKVADFGQLATVLAKLRALSNVTEAERVG
ncbi:MAG: bifunctional (p)ppGpp synthetase/guanosine-3',5'-bis(diphosphate) 3'-pyrophosphohydrolase [Xanthomonadales bacterium]|nr:GTP pyrophosphokinase [Xanthomonadales bacterium]MCC6592032.1 bifunctional (p)ppGpp synthetase/guanosine-3',5'-bis(diphosphate) 3'-pyrophosphohydrolase [Xanthomonadales bacterium]MCE7932417.1 bifunctional (p)ppGpp synthetase/guanosine-3',5'-bis(diphosphate) 3'-pyrophosphohydrolase [Xanthomonadales bacterium PRO6]